MNGMRMWGMGAIVALSAALSGPTGLDAQIASATGDQVRAANLEKQAETLATSRAGFDEAEGLFRKAADLRDGTLQAVSPRRMAGRLAYYLGNLDRAYRDFEEAGETALEWGDVVNAANAFLDAAWVARENGQGRQAVAMLSRARKLSHSPLIAAVDRRALEGRIAAQ